MVTHTVKTAQNNVHIALDLSGHAQGKKAKRVCGRGGGGGCRQPAVARGVSVTLLLGVSIREGRGGGALPKWACFVGNSAERRERNQLHFAVDVLLNWFLGWSAAAPLKV